MNLQKILPALQSIAPTVATALGGPLAGMAVTALESMLGLAPGAAEADGGKALTAAVLGMSPETAAKMRAADQDFAIKLKQLDIDLEALAAKDRDSARAMQTQTRSVVPGMLAGGVTAGFFGLLGLMAFRPIPEVNHDALMMMLGALGAAFTGVVQFFFGSSAGSQAKDATIRDMRK